MILPHSRQHELCDCIVARSFLRILDRISRQRLEEVWAHVQSLVWSPSRSLLERLRNSQTKPKTKTWWASRCWYAHWGRSALNLVSNICRLTLCSRENVCSRYWSLSNEEPVILWENRNDKLTRDQNWDRFTLRCDNCVKDPKCCSWGGHLLVAQVTACPSHLRMRVLF